LVLFLFHALVVPSGFTTSVQPHDESRSGGGTGIAARRNGRNGRVAMDRKGIIPDRASHLVGTGILRPSEVMAMTREEEATRVEDKPGRDVQPATEFFDQCKI
jgi:hypothetical protein